MRGKLFDKEYEILKERRGDVNIINRRKNLSSAHISKNCTRSNGK